MTNQEQIKPDLPTSQNKPISKPLTNKDKLFLKNLKEAKFNKTRAYSNTYPNSQYDSSRANVHQKLKRIANNSKVTIEDLIDKSNDIIKELYESKSVKVEKKADIAVQLTKRQVTDKQENKTPDKIVIMYNKEPQAHTNRIDTSKEQV